MQQPAETSLEKAYELSVDAVRTASQEASGVETKIIGVFAIASAIVGITASLASFPISPLKWYWPNIFFYLAILAYVWTLLLWSFLRALISTS
jgi:hypothetical protein